MGMQSSTRLRYLITVTIRTKINSFRVPSSHERKRSNGKFIISTPANFQFFFSIILPLIQSFNYSQIENCIINFLFEYSASSKFFSAITLEVRQKEVEDCGGNARNRGTVTPAISHEYEIIP